jgi:hypothetical protein
MNRRKNCVKMVLGINGNLYVVGACSRFTHLQFRQIRFFLLKEREYSR